MKIKNKLDIVLIIVLVIMLLSFIFCGAFIYDLKNKEHFTNMAALKIIDKLSYITIPVAVNEDKCKDINVYISGHVEYSTLDRNCSNLLQKLPVSYDSFINDDGILVVSSNLIQDAKKFYKMKIGEDIQGFYRKSGNIPVIWINTDFFEDNKEDSINENVAKFFVSYNFATHEMAHYIDDKYSISSCKEFQKYYKKYANNYKERTTTKGYAMTDEKEFFAILYSEMLSYSADTLKISDDLYNFMKNVFKETEHISIERD